VQFGAALPTEKLATPTTTKKANTNLAMRLTIAPYLTTNIV
jgi:hypothetical protein